MNKVIELFGAFAEDRGLDWRTIVRKQQCPFEGKKCYKVRKSDSKTSIGTCTVAYGSALEPIVICPKRLIERRQIFVDCLHLLASHEPGNELHIVSEISVPGGSVDYFLVSTKSDRVRDFVGIELQTLDTTGTVWPERQRLLKEFEIPRGDKAENSEKSFGMNWKMTAKTILVQMHHKAETFEHVGKKLVLVVQDRLLTYMTREFSFGHLSSPPVLGDAVHFHAYRMVSQPSTSIRLSLQTRLSTDSAGIAHCLGLQAEARVELEEIVKALQSKISSRTLFSPV